MTDSLLSACSHDDCPALESDLSSFELLHRLTDPCRYDRFSRPNPVSGEALPIFARMFVYYLGSVETHSLVSIDKLRVLDG